MAWWGYNRRRRDLLMMAEYLISEVVIDIVVFNHLEEVTVTVLKRQFASYVLLNNLLTLVVLIIK